MLSNRLQSGLVGYLIVRYGIDKIEHMLSKTGRISADNDNIPYWVDCDYSSELAKVGCRIANMSIGLGVVPSAWRTAIITPVPKCTPVNREGT